MENRAYRCYQNIPINPETSKDLICSIGQGIFRNPVATPHGTTYCRDCISEWLENKSSDPLTRKPLSKPELFKNQVINNLVERISVFCTSQPQCGWQGTLKEYDFHQRNACEFEEIKCLHSKCNEYFKRRDMINHLEQCQFKEYLCDFCMEITFSPNELAVRE